MSNKYGFWRDPSTIMFHIIGYLLVSVTALLCAIPFLLILSASFSSEASILRNGYSLIPKEFSLDAYIMLLRYPTDVARAYIVSVFITVVGTAIGLTITAMAAYVLNRKDFKYRNQFSFYFYFVTLFNGGLVSTYIMMVRYYHLKNNLLVACKV
jgi:putative aldouronate transport system permease protein